MHKRLIQIAEPCTGEEEWQALREPLFSGWLTQGPQVALFEQEFARRHAVARALATTSCTTALHLALLALGVGPGHEVIVPAFTWVATANVVRYCGATPVFADVDPATFNIDVADALSRVTSRTKAVIAVHLFGLCADVDALRQGLPEGVAIVEDAACAAGAAVRGRPAGSLGEVGAFSFHPRKSITTGEGGMLTTSDHGIAARAESLRNHGASVSEEQRHHGPKPHILPDFEALGYNYRMTDLQGAVGRVQLGKLDGFIEERARWARWYGERLGGVKGLRLPVEPKDARHAWQAYVVFVDQAKASRPRNEIMDLLFERGVATRPGTHALHLLGLYRREMGLSPHDYPGARDCDACSMAIPLHNRMSADDFEHVARSLEEVV